MAIAPLVTHGYGSFTTIALLTTHGFGLGAPLPPVDDTPSGSYPRKKLYQDVPAGWEPLEEPRKRRKKRQTPEIFERTPATVQQLDAIDSTGGVDLVAAYNARLADEAARHRQQLLDEDEIILRLFT